jgi:hypothetical protein
MQPVSAQPAAVPEKYSETLEAYAARMAMRITVVAAVVLGLLILFANLNRNPVPLAGDLRAFGTLALLSMMPIALVAAALGFVWGTQAWNLRVAESRRRQWTWSVLPVALAYALMVLVLSIFGLLLVENAFATLELERFQGAFLAAAAGGMLIYWTVQQVMQISAMKVIQVVTLILAGGVYFTAAGIEDPYWWQESFSYLGTLNSNARRLFNFTLVFAGILLLVWLPYFRSDFALLVKHGMAPESSSRRFQLAFTVLAVALALVGAFPFGDSRFSSIMHNLSAYSLAGVFVLVLLGLRWLVPGFEREFFVVSWILMAAIIATLVLAAFGYFNTVGLEFVCFGLVITWLQLFMRSVEIHTHKLEPSAFPQ